MVHKLTIRCAIITRVVAEAAMMVTGRGYEQIFLAVGKHVVPVKAVVATGL